MPLKLSLAQFLKVVLLMLIVDSAAAMMFLMSLSLFPNCCWPGLAKCHVVAAACWY